MTDVANRDPQESIDRSARGILWDMDGTMVNTAALHFRAWSELAKEIGRAFSRDDFTRTFGWRNAEIIPTVFGPKDSEEEIARLGDRKEEWYRELVVRHGVDLLPGVGALLESCSRAGYRQAVGSSAPRANVDLILSRTHIASFFQAVVSAEDIRRGKPDPEVFQLAARRLGVLPGRCVVIEDAPVGIQAARAAGMRCIAVVFAGHHSSDALHAAGADLVVDSLESVSPATIRRWLDP